MTETPTKKASQFGILKTTAIGGLFFLLPLIILGALIAQMIPLINGAAKWLLGVLPLKTVSGVILISAIVLLVILLLCFVAGIIARRSVGQRISTAFEKNIGLMFPRYTVIKEQMRGSIGGDDMRPEMKPVLARMNDGLRIGFEIERDGDLVAVYLPGAPDAWSGKVLYMNPDRLEPVSAEFWDTILVFGSLGRGSLEMLSQAGQKGDA